MAMAGSTWWFWGPDLERLFGIGAVIFVVGALLWYAVKELARRK